MKRQVAIVDCGGANIASLANALTRLGVGSVLTADAATIESADHVLLPGVGAAADAMQKLHDRQLTAVVRKLTQPVLGVCLGMHLLAESSEENLTECLGIMPGAARMLTASPATPVPNMGWCRVNHSREHPLLDGIRNGSYFYFVHSYALPVTDFTVATSTHAAPLTAIAARQNFFATQFHPERSAAAGARLLSNFLAMKA